MPPQLLFDFPDPAGRTRRLCFARPRRLLIARTVPEVRGALRQVQRALDAGLYAAGYLAYEAAPAFDPALTVREPNDLPLAWFGLFDGPSEPPPGPPADESGYRLSPWEPETPADTYRARVTAIRESLGRGDAYQVNYTLRLRARLQGDPYALYRHLSAAAGAAYSAYLDLGSHAILSVSPELFFQRRGDHVVTRPMKGTARRGRWLEEDEACAAGLRSSEKDRAENLMIVDLLRNDLGRVAIPGSVRVPQLFALERYPTLWQMTSTVEARLPECTDLPALFAALFPCGSVTGAPKIAAMRQIAALEDSPRGVYCGAIGWAGPGDRATFSVAIRTAVFHRETGDLEYGVGGGITWDSTPDDEYQEALAKAAVLTARRPAFELLETLRLEEGRYTLLERHLARLDESARYFDVPLCPTRVRDALAAFAATRASGVWRARLLVSLEGAVRVESAEFSAPPALPARVALARAPVRSDDPFLFHKTTHRAVYDTRRADRPDAFDVLLWNEAGELTEFTTGNLVVEIDGEAWTPPRACGLLAGCLRAELLERGEIRERVLTVADLARATRLWYVNSVRGRLPVLLATNAPASSTR